MTMPILSLGNQYGEGMLKNLRESSPEANIVAVDYRSESSEVNQLNRIKLMLSAAKEQR